MRLLAGAPRVVPRSEGCTRPDQTRALFLREQIEVTGGGDLEVLETMLQGWRWCWASLVGVELVGESWVDAGE